MDRVCLIFPIIVGREDRVEPFFDELESMRRSEYQRSQNRLGVKQESWFVTRIGSDRAIVAYVVYDDFRRAVELFSTSTDAFDAWFKQGLYAMTGIDFDHPPPLELPELVSHYQSDE